MKVLFFTILLSFILPSSNLEEIRLSFQKASKDKQNAVHFNELVKKDLVIDNTLKSAYLGASEASLAKYESSPAAKLRLFKSGVANIEKAVTAKPSNVEIRLIRLIIQRNSPPKLKYTGAIDEDKAFILDAFPTAPTDVKSFVKQIAKDTDIFNQEELTKIK